MMMPNLTHLVNWIEFHLVYGNGVAELYCFWFFFYILTKSGVGKSLGQAFFFWVVYCFAMNGRGIG